MNVLSMLGINPDDIDDSKMGVAENITTNPQDNLALSSEDFGNDDNYYSYQVGDHVLFRVQWINSTKFFLFSEDISYTAN